MQGWVSVTRHFSLIAPIHARVSRIIKMKMRYFPNVQVLFWLKTAKLTLIPLLIWSIFLCSSTILGCLPSRMRRHLLRRQEASEDSSRQPWEESSTPVCWNKIASMSNGKYLDNFQVSDSSTSRPRHWTRTSCRTSGSNCYLVRANMSGLLNN